MNISATANSPCLNCPDRHLHCHSECGKYQEYKAELEEHREIERARIEEGNFLREMKRPVLERHMKRKKGDGKA